MLDGNVRLPKYLHTINVLDSNPPVEGNNSIILCEIRSGHVFRVKLLNIEIEKMRRRVRGRLFLFINIV